MIDVYIGLGSNLGQKEENIKKAIDLLKKECTIVKISSLYETEPVGYENQDWFLNAVVKLETRLEPIELLTFAQDIEKILGRKRIIKNGPRTIDIDILFYEDQVLHEETLILPHPRLHERGFVLVPLLEIEPDFLHPIFKKTIAELYYALPKEKIVRRKGS